MHELIAQAAAHFNRFINTVKPIHNMVLSIAQKTGEAAKVLITNPLGAGTQTIVGNLVVTGSFSYGGGLATNLVSEVPAGTVDGTNKVFSLTQTPLSASLRVFQNGFLLTPDIHYTFDQTAITYVDGFQPIPGDRQIAYYETPIGDNGVTLEIIEVPAGAADGVNKIFTLSNTPTAGSLALFQNGILLSEVLHYTLDGTTLTYANGFQPSAAEAHQAIYRHA